MKTTIDLPDPLFRKVKATAAAEGVSLKAFITEAILQRLNAGSRPLAEVLGSLPAVPKKVLKKVQKRVEASDAEDLAYQQGGRAMILDTNAVSALADRDADILAVLGDEEKAVLSFIAVAEFRFGLLGSKKDDSGTAFLVALTVAMPVLYPDSETIDCYSRIADQQKRSGKPIPQNDMWTAALAMQTGMPVLTRDRRHFDLVDGIGRVCW